MEGLMIFIYFMFMIVTFVLLVIFVISHKQMADSQKEVAASIRMIAINLKNLKSDSE